jgi:hypothetical protein
MLSASRFVALFTSEVNIQCVMRVFVDAHLKNGVEEEHKVGNKGTYAYKAIVLSFVKSSKNTNTEEDEQGGQDR